MAIRLCNLLWRILLAGVLLLAAWEKLRTGISPTVETIYDRVVAGSQFRHFGIIGTEIAIAVWLISAWRERVAGVVAGLLLISFTVMLALELNSKDPTVCGCGLMRVMPGGDPRDDLRLGIVRNGVLLLGCVWLALMGNPPARAEPEPNDAAGSAPDHPQQ